MTLQCTLFPLCRTWPDFKLQYFKNLSLDRLEQEVSAGQVAVDFFHLTPHSHRAETYQLCSLPTLYFLHQPSLMQESMEVDFEV